MSRSALRGATVRPVRGNRGEVSDVGKRDRHCDRSRILAHDPGMLGLHMLDETDITTVVTNTVACRDAI